MGIDRSDPDAPNPIYDEAREHLYERSVVQAVEESGSDVLELPAAPEWRTLRGGRRCRVHRAPGGPTGGRRW